MERAQHKTVSNLSGFLQRKSRRGGIHSLVDDRFGEE
jgi:hypothetical protein